MGLLKLFTLFIVLFEVRTSTPVSPSTGGLSTGGLSIQQLIQIINQITVENNNLKSELKTVQAVLELSIMEATNCKNKNSTDASNILSRNTALEAEQAKLMAKLNDCDRTRSILMKSNTIQHNVINASKTEHDRCLKELKETNEELQGYLNQTCKPLYPRSCQEWKAAGYTEDGDYMVDPDGPDGVNRFLVECEMDSHRGVPVTVMHHDSEARLLAGTFEDPYSNVKNITYKASLLQIMAFINISSNCEQYISYECLNSRISGYATWYSRDGTPMYYWGGAKPGSGKCAGGMTNSCATVGTVCNCDTLNDNQWHADSGILTDRSMLPVTRMSFGDLSVYYGNFDEIGYHKLGALRCYDLI